MLLHRDNTAEIRFMTGGSFPGDTRIPHIGNARRVSGD